MPDTHAFDANAHPHIITFDTQLPTPVLLLWTPLDEEAYSMGFTLTFVHTHAYVACPSN
jgi:hypothetical protein